MPSVLTLRAFLLRGEGLLKISISRRGGGLLERGCLTQYLEITISKVHQKSNQQLCLFYLSFIMHMPH